uniref:Uncharacterized protein n=1 Tax=Arundo donax TaxID=35708 RepID=A0A0A9AAL9_ARUDO
MHLSSNYRLSLLQIFYLHFLLFDWLLMSTSLQKSEYISRFQEVFSSVSSN